MPDLQAECAGTGGTGRSTEPRRRSVAGRAAALGSVAAATVAALSVSMLGQRPPPRSAARSCWTGLTVRTVVTGLVTPSSLAFLGPGDLLVLDTTGSARVRPTGVQDGAITAERVTRSNPHAVLDVQACRQGRSQAAQATA
jgi:hypothetical protein